MVLGPIILTLLFACGNCWFYMHHYPFFHHHHHRFPPLFVSNCQENGDCKMCLVNDVHWCLPCGTYKLCGKGGGGKSSGASISGPTGGGTEMSVDDGTTEIPEDSAKKGENEDSKYEDVGSTEKHHDDEEHDKHDEEDKHEDNEYAEVKEDDKHDKHLKHPKHEEQDEDKQHDEDAEHGKDKQHDEEDKNTEEDDGEPERKIRSFTSKKETSETGSNQDRLGSIIFGKLSSSKFGTVLLELSKKDFKPRLSLNPLDSVSSGLRKVKSVADSSHCPAVKNLTDTKVVPPVGFNSSVAPQSSTDNYTSVQFIEV